MISEPSRDIGYQSRASEHFHIREGDNAHYIIRDYPTRTAAHIQIPITGNPVGPGARNPHLVVAFPAGESAVCFRTSDALWNLRQLDPYRGKGTGQHGVMFKIRSDRKQVSINLAWLVLHNLLYLRHVIYYWPDHGDYPKTLVQTGQETFTLVGRHDQRLFDNLSAISRQTGMSLSDLMNRTTVRIEVTTGKIHAYRETLEGKNRYELEITIPPEAKLGTVQANGDIEISSNEQVEITVRASVDFIRPTPVPMTEILSPETLAAAGNNAALYTTMRNFSSLVYEEKLLAGSWFYLVYFGRDTLNAGRLMWAALSDKAKQIILDSVLSRLADDGTVAVVEELNEWPVHCALEDMNRLIVAKNYPAAATILKEIMAGTRNRMRVYNVLDATFMLPIVFRDFLSEATPGKKQSFLNAATLENIYKNINKVLALTDGYTRTRNQKQLIRLMDSAGDIGNWRDSAQGLGFGKYPADMNVSLGPAALESIAVILKTIPDTAHDYGGISAATAAWEQSKHEFMVHYSAREIREKISRYLRESAIPETEKTMIRNLSLPGGTTIHDFLKQGMVPETLAGGISFTAISLDDNGKPVPIMHSDEVYSLLDRDLAMAETERIVDYIFLPYPIGLMTAAGMVAANAVYQDNKKLWGSDEWEGLNRNAYHGAVIWGWPMRALTLGLCRQIRHAIRSGFEQSYIARLKGCLKLLATIDERIGRLGDSELWTWEPDRSGTMQPIAFGIGRCQPSTPVQLWSASSVSVTVDDLS